MEISLDKLGTKHSCHSFKECLGSAERGLCPCALSVLLPSPAMESLGGSWICSLWSLCILPFSAGAALELLTPPSSRGKAASPALRVPRFSSPHQRDMKWPQAHWHGRGSWLWGLSEPISSHLRWKLHTTCSSSQ